MIRLEGLTRIFRVGDQDVHALDGIDLHVLPGEYVSVMGPSGSGKSTLLHILGLLDQPTSGRYLFDGKDVTGLSEQEQARVRSEKIGFVFQFFHLVPRLTAIQNVELPLVLAGVLPAIRKRRAAQVLEAVGLEERGTHRPEQLSGGQRQRVAIARAVVTQPALLLADEPTGNLDRNSGMEVVNLLERQNSQGITLILVTHDHEIGRRALRQIKLMDGKIVQDLCAGPRP